MTTEVAAGSLDAPRAPVVVLKSRLLQANGVVHGFPTRHGGHSVAPFASLNLGKSVGDAPEAVDANLDAFARAAGFERARLATVSQVHGDVVVVGVATANGTELRANRRGEPLQGLVEADAVIATDGVVAGVRVADCVPVLLHDPVTGLSAAIHAGWRGTVAKIVRRTVDVLVRDFGVRPASLRAAIGPSIGRCCYEVDRPLGERFASDPDFGPATVEPRGDANPHLDLWTANERLLLLAGLKPHHVDRLDRCTSCDTEAPLGPTFFSHRRDAGRTGRHLAVVAGGRG